MTTETFGITKKRRRPVTRIWWCKQHRAERSYNDELGLTLCWKAEGLHVLDNKPCRVVEMQLASDDFLVIADMPLFLDALDQVGELG